MLSFGVAEVSLTQEPEVDLMTSVAWFSAHAGHLKARLLDCNPLDRATWK